MVESVRRMTVLAVVLLMAAFAIAAPSHAYAVEDTTAIEPATGLQDVGDFAIEAVEESSTNSIGVGNVNAATDTDGNIVDVADSDEGTAVALDAEVYSVGSDSVDDEIDAKGGKVAEGTDGVEAAGATVVTETASVEVIEASTAIENTMIEAPAAEKPQHAVAVSQSTAIVTQDDPTPTPTPLTTEYNPVATIATGGAYEIIRMQRIDGVDYLILPSYANINALSISWAEKYLGNLVFASSERNGNYSDAVFNAAACSTDAVGARVAYVRATKNGLTHVLHIAKSASVRTLYLKSEDPANEGRAYIENSADHSTKTTGVITLVAANGSVVVQDAELTQIKGRGNSTWGADKKPYQIKLADKASLLDGTSANKSKTWVLLANAYDDTLLHNFIALKTAIAAGLTATPDCEYVDLYYDGEYRGLYLLTEKVQVGTGRIEIAEFDDSALESLPTAVATNAYGYIFRFVNDGTRTVVSNPTGGFLIELDNATYSSERCYFNTSVGYFVLKSPENATWGQVKYISEFVQAAINAASTSDGNAAKYFDLASLAKYFLVNELGKSSDYMRYSSTFFYKGAGSDVLHAGPVWDLDLSFGVHMYEGYAEYIDAAGITDPNSTFFAKNKQFIAAVKKELSSGFLSNAKKWVGTGAGSLSNVVANMRPAFALDELKWGYYDPTNVVVVKFPTYEQSRDYLADWMKRRIAWMERDLASNLDALSAQPTPVAGSSASVTRLSGDTALDTMSTIVNAGGFASGKFAILVTSEGYWDALTASGIAGMVGAPIIMTPAKHLAEQARAQLAKLRPGTIIVCGGTMAITDAVARAAAQAAGGAKIERCAGQDAVGTAISIYDRAVKLTGGQWATSAFICTNGGYWDALSAAPISYAMHMPIFLTNGSKSISAETLAALKRGGIHEVYIVGGTLAISQEVETAIKNAGIVIGDRLAGQTAVETSEAVASYGLKRGMSANLMGVATTNGYWDALSGSAFCGKKHSVIVLVNSPNCHSVKNFMFLNSARVRQAYVFGGVMAVAQTTFEAARRSLSGLLS